jgi:hypothetical protein
LALFLVAAPAATASSTVIDTRSESTETVQEFGVPDTATYGQVITAPPGSEFLRSFTFRVELPFTDFFRGEVYAWDGEKATGPALFESPPRTTSGTEAQDVTFDTGMAPVAPGSQYVIFTSVSKEFEQSAGFGAFRSVPDTTYEGGKFVFLNNGTNEAEWTTTPWESFLEFDLQFRARFVSSSQTLIVAKAGNGNGTVTSSVGGIDCGSSCRHGYGDEATVALQAVPAPGSVFTGFSGAGCSASPCVVTMDNDKSVTAQFVDNFAPQTTIVKRTNKKVSFKSSEPVSTFTCKLDRAKARRCTSPFAFKHLAPGRHTFSVAATDAAGNVDRSPAKVRFTTE